MPLPWFILITAYGACVGSFLNVVIYRLPLGQSIIHPPSRCPKCSHKLAWHDNVPVLGWLWLRGSCRYCKNPISPQYPIIEALTAALFAALLYAYFDAGHRSDFFSAGIASAWPVLIVHLVMLGGLIAATAIDAKLFIIPLSIPYVTALLALIVFPGVELFWPPVSQGIYPIPIQTLMPRATGSWAGVAAGGFTGLVLAVVLLRLGVFKQSFVVEETAAKAEDAKPQALPDKPVEPAKPASAARVRLQLILGLFIAALLAVVLGGAWGLVVAAALLMLGVLPLVIADDEQVTQEQIIEMIHHPAPRREMLKEIAFLMPVAAGAAAGGLLPVPTELPGWLQVLDGVVLGFLAGGGIVWLVRILGTLAFGKEAMGLGDVHLLAGIGAVLGPVDAVLVFFIAPFFGLSYALIAFGLSRLAKGGIRVIPFGPFLAAAAVVVAVFREPILSVLGIL